MFKTVQFRLMISKLAKLFAAIAVAGAFSPGLSGETVYRFDAGERAPGSYEDGWRSIWTSEKQAWRIEPLHGSLHLTHRSQIGAPRALILEEVGEVKNAEILARMMSTADGAQNRLVLRAGGRKGSETGYHFDFRPGNNIRISKYEDGRFRQIGANASWPRDTHRWYWVRFRAEGDQLRARIWPDGEPEPDEWTIERQDNSITGPGGVGIGSYGADGTRYYDNIRVGVDGASAPMPSAPDAVTQVRILHPDATVAVVKADGAAGVDQASIVAPLHTARATLQLVFYGEGGRRYPLSEDNHRVELEIADPHIARFDLDDSGTSGGLWGFAPGLTSMRVRCFRDGEEIFRSAWLPVETSDDREWMDWVNQNTPFPWAEPEEVGMSRKGLANMSETLRRYVATEEIVGGIMMVVRDGRLVFFETRGWNDRERGLLMRPDQIFQVRSMTKMLTGAAFLMQMEEGLAQPGDRVSDYLPSWDNPQSRDITLHHLLTHTGGLHGSIDHDADNLVEAVAVVGERGPNAEPGSRYRYSDAGSSTLGAVVAVLSGETGCEPLKHARIFKPLGMHDTFCSTIPDGDPRRERVAARYSGGKGNWSKYSEAAELESNSWCRASGGVYSTIFDWSRFMAAMLNGGAWNGVRLLQSETVDLATQPHAAFAYSEEERATQSRYYGYHVDTATDQFGQVPSPMSARFFGHGGSDGLYSLVDPEYDLIALFFTQSRFHRRTGEDSRERFIELVYEAIER